ncbi:MAG TPA: hypothetical protein VE690_12280, partial [Rhodopila sp.]|nr:hypothetical protein [Rhodopila sp.]
TDGIYSSVGPDSVIELGGTLQGLNVDITKMQGPPIESTATLGFIGWTELTLDGPNAQIYQWQTATSTYIGIEATLNDIGARGTLDVLNGRNYSTTQSLTVEAQGMLNLQAGTVTLGGLTVAGILQGTGTITNAVVNNGTIDVLAGVLADGTTKATVLDIAGALSGTGSVVFDHDEKAGTVVATGGTLMVGTVAAGQNIVMNGDDTLVLAQAGAFLGTIDAKIGDRIILQGMTATSAVDNNGTLVISNGTATVATLKVAGDMASDSFTASGSIITVGSAAATSGQFTVDDSTTKQVTTVAGVPYNGPVAGLTSQYVFPTTDQVMVKAQTPNVFIQVGQLGQKNPLIAGIDVSAANGNNVLDCYANSSFLIDGTGIDQNYIDARGATQNSWSTVVNFHAGDNVTIWGLTAQDFTLQWIGDTYGADGAKGLTGVYTPNTGTLAIGITLAGYTMADVSNGKLTVSYNQIDGNAYASIHANTPA